MSEYAFTEDWFSDHRILWNVILSKYKPKRVLEIGCFEGRATTYLFETLSGVAGAHISCIDPWREYWEMGVLMDQVESRFDQNVALARSKFPSVDFRKMKGLSADWMAKLLLDREKFDLIYVDHD